MPGMICGRSGHLAAAFVDVFEHEPLAGVPNLVLTPHIAGVTVESNARVGQMIASEIATHLQSQADR